jgi:hypothetical protein
MDHVQVMHDCNFFEKKNIIRKPSIIDKNQEMRYTYDEVQQ